MIKKLKHLVYKALTPFIRLWKHVSWLFYLRNSKEIKLIVGAGGTHYKGWFSTDIITLDITNKNHFRKYFTRKKINRILAEHVFEHLSDAHLKLAVKNFFGYSDNDIIIRIAVPDGFHTDLNYINYVKPGGTGLGADDHKHLFNYKSLSEYFEKEGFISYPMDYWDENGTFHNHYLGDDNGYISRSMINDIRNKDGKPNYTSLIIDFKKK